MTFRFEIKSRFSSATIFTAELDAKFEHSSETVKLGEAVKAAVKAGAYLGGAYLGGANLRDANLGGADLGGAYLVGADLRDANLRDANLRDANLGGAYLGGADLGDAKINDHIITKIITRVVRQNDEYEFIAFETEKGILIRAGCQTKTPAEYRAHVAADYPNTAKAEETLAIIDFIEARAAVVCAKSEDA